MRTKVNSNQKLLLSIFVLLTVGMMLYPPFQITIRGTEMNMGYGFLFDPPKNRRLANIISIKSPMDFRESIQEVKKGGVTTEEKRALNLAQTRAKLQLRRENLSMKERDEFTTISRMRLPKITRR